MGIWREMFRDFDGISCLNDSKWLKLSIAIVWLMEAVFGYVWMFIIDYKLQAALIETKKGLKPGWWTRWVLTWFVPGIRSFQGTCITEGTFVFRWCVSVATFMGLSSSSWGYPNSYISWKIQLKWMIWGYPHFRNQPYRIEEVHFFYSAEDLCYSQF